MIPFAQAKREELSRVRFVLHDIDDTITTEGRLPAVAFAALWRLHDAGYAVIPVTGRPAGWCDMIVREWPVAAVIGEGGAFAYYWDGEHVKTLLHKNAAPHPEALRPALVDAVLSTVPGVRIARDQPFRIYDTAFDFREEPPFLPTEVGYEILRVCRAHGATASLGTAHVNAYFGDYNKASMAQALLARVYRCTDPNEVLYFGDSPNDEPMFLQYPISCGVQNLLPRAAEFRRLPRYLARLPFGEGFADAVERFLETVR